MIDILKKIFNLGFCFRFSIFVMKWVIMERGVCGKMLEFRLRWVLVSLWNKVIYGRYFVFYEICFEDFCVKLNFMLFNMFLYINVKLIWFLWFFILLVRLVMILWKVLIIFIVIFSMNYFMKMLDILY